jgi:hypothetical protein
MRPRMRDPCHKAARQASASKPKLKCKPKPRQKSKRAGSFTSGRSVVVFPAQRRGLVVVNDQPKNPEKARQKERLRAALRENLKRRKVQAKGRAAGAAREHASHDSAGFAEDNKDS